MSPEQIALVRSSWRRVLPIQDVAAQLFYERLFALDPSIKPLFRGDITEQGQKLMTMLGTVVSHLHRLDDVVSAARALGRRHLEYGVAPSHYDTVGTALLSTLRVGLGDGLTREAEDAWAIAYATLAGVMKQAFADARANGPTNACAQRK
jgi:hemoglobin-like flavoprotein